MSFENQNLNKPLPAHEVVAEKKRRKLEAEINLLEGILLNVNQEPVDPDTRSVSVTAGETRGLPKEMDPGVPHHRVQEEPRHWQGPSDLLK